jgi:antitoxin FitA
MASITIRQVDELIKARLRVQAAHHGHSMEEEAREILKSALTSEGGGRVHPVESIRRRIKAIGGVNLLIPRRGPIRDLPELDK